MKTALIIHGIGGHAGIHWQQWLHDELQATGFNVLMPNLSNSDHPDRKVWLKEIEDIVAGVDLASLTIIGHSLGVTTALDLIESAEEEINDLVAVSGFAEDYGLELNHYFLIEKNIDMEKVKSKLKSAVVIYGDDDPYVTQGALRHVADSLEVKPLVIQKGGHLNTNTGYTEFPQLLEQLKAIA